MTCVLKGLKLRVAAAIISAILFYGVITFIVSTPTQTLAAKELQKMPAPRITVTPRTTITKTVTAKAPIPKPRAEVGAEAYGGLVERGPESGYKVLVQNLLISAAIALAIMAIFRVRMR